MATTFDGRDGAITDETRMTLSSAGGLNRAKVEPLRTANRWYTQSVLGRFILVMGLIAMLFGQVPARVTVCSCTGEVAVAEVGEREVCAKHRLPKCDHCKPKPGKGCFVTKAGSRPFTAVLPRLEQPEFAVLLPVPITVIEAAWQPVWEPHPCLVLPRIREPDLVGHQLRAPPVLA